MNATLNLFEAAKPTPVGFREFPIQEFKPFLGRVRVVDVREPHEFEGELGHLPGAELVPLNEVVDAAKGWDPKQELALVCRAGARSGQAALWLKELGFEKVVNLKGGMLAWPG